MASVVNAEDLKSSPTAARFEGGRFGSSVSFFLTNHPPGARVELHCHPYDETFVVEAGSATFNVDGQAVHAREGQIVIVPAGAVHGFVNDGDGPLRVVGIHPSEWIEQEQVES
ncbi:MAG TPA: cupin domain-containing protein [Thermoleophilaceae bacterium]|nr:cupin domain-containing protein [Thermoleophilaceae bacterium]